MHGPGPPGSWYSPVYPYVPEIVVIDRVAPSLKLRKKKRWRKHRDEGLGVWMKAGIRFIVTETTPLTTPYTFVGLGEPDYTPAAGVGSETVAPIQKGTITLARSVYTPASPKWWPMAWAIWYSSMGGSVAFFHLERLRSSEKMGAPTYAWWRTIGHEVGHCLGLVHGSNGIMTGGMLPSYHDLDSLRAWYRT